MEVEALSDTLRGELIRLAHGNPDLRATVLPLLRETTDKTAAATMMLDNNVAGLRQAIADDNWQEVGWLTGNLLKFFHWASDDPAFKQAYDILSRRFKKSL